MIEVEKEKEGVSGPSYSPLSSLSFISLSFTFLSSSSVSLFSFPTPPNPFQPPFLPLLHHFPSLLLYLFFPFSFPFSFPFHISHLLVIPHPPPPTVHFSNSILHRTIHPIPSNSKPIFLSSKTNHSTAQYTTAQHSKAKQLSFLHLISVLCACRSHLHRSSRYH